MKNYQSNLTERVEMMDQRENGKPRKNGNLDHGENEEEGCCEMVLYVVSLLLILLTFPVSIWFCLRQVQQYERAVIFRLGKLKKGGAVGPGLFFIIPCIDNIIVIDLRTVSFDIPPQEILTKDSVTVSVDAVVYYNVRDPIKAVCNVMNFAQSTKLLALTTVRTVLGTKTLVETLSDRENVAKDVLAQLVEPVKPWGIEVERVEMKDVRLPVQLQRAMAAEAEATREAKAKVIAAKGEENASQALTAAADIIAKSPGALQLRYLQTLNTISSEKNSTIIFPLPMDFMTAFVNRKE